MDYNKQYLTIFRSERTLFRLIKAEVEYNSGDFATALTTCETAYELNGIKEKSFLL